MTVCLMLRLPTITHQDRPGLVNPRKKAHYKAALEGVPLGVDGIGGGQSRQRKTHCD
jgi:hypothetical protein